jgi:hypothetical protein
MKPSISQTQGDTNETTCQIEICFVFTRKDREEKRQEKETLDHIAKFNEVRASF